jgi:hypothetical protein
MDSDTLTYVLVGLGFVALVGGLVYLGRRIEQKRREALRQLANELGLSFEPEPDEALLEKFAGLQAFSGGRDHQLLNRLRGRLGRQEMLYFEHKCVTGSGKSLHVHRESMVAFPLGSAAWPDFEVRPELWAHRFGKAFGLPDIDIPDYPDFSKGHVIRGKDEDAVRGLFDAVVTEALEGKQDLCIESGSGWLVVYRADERVAVRKIADFLEEARGVRSAFARGAGRQR